MKKLLSLLSVLTISGTAVPTTIATSPYAKDFLDKKLNIIPIVQEKQYFCAPTTGLMILRHLRLNQHSNHWTGNDDLSQTNLGFAMQTTSTSGTTQENFVNAINSWIGNRLNGRQYSRLNLNSIYNHILGEGSNTFFEIIRTSLENDIPVALLHNGRSVTTGNLEFQQHAMLFSGYRGNINSPEDIIYIFIDPWDGNTHEISARNLFNYSLNWGVSEIAAYIPNSQSENQIPRPNQTEPMEIGNCGGVIRQAIIENNLHCILGTRSKRDYLNNNLSCPSAANPYYEYYGNNNEKNDYFRVWGKSGHDGIELKISLKTALAFENFFQQNQSLEIKNYLENLIKHVEQKNDTWSGGWILDTDIELMKNFIYDGYLKFHDKLLELIDAENRKKKNNSIFVRTWRTYNWANLSEEYQNSAFYISKNSKGNNY
ncbi:hypothetical protein D6D54_00945 [Spiroplasma poulsonii]|uniref:Peptidase C39-like domain-containing protein n=1 Tax=Spiroplasma poulsonii TaxID=2138 RepID=A0A3S0UNH9_9MOLU|nr:C39 family peptidase [Spiroplasma poulsonii]MBW3057794.1 hypothetical protein [Spiroplasma poulsonii]MBW3059266.1 hypothetical protein [Spiroplasma poulsonii]RUP78073.1 hypothetical protein D6D54_00945 [Spiroplasma poulsonii]